MLQIFLKFLCPLGRQGRSSHPLFHLFSNEQNGGCICLTHGWETFPPVTLLSARVGNCPLDKGRLSIHWGKGEPPPQKPPTTHSLRLCASLTSLLEYGFGLARARGMLVVLSRRSLTSTYRGNWLTPDWVMWSKDFAPLENPQAVLSLEDRAYSCSALVFILSQCPKALLRRLSVPLEKITKLLGSIQIPEVNQSRAKALAPPSLTQSGLRLLLSLIRYWY